MSDALAMATKIEACRERPGFGTSWGYHSRVSVMHGYVCMAIPKNGATTIKRTLRAFEGLAPIEDHGLLHEATHQDRLSSFSTAQAASMLTSTDWLRFGFVRNPYDRAFSAWKSKIANLRDPQYEWLRQEIRRAVGPGPTADGHAPVVEFGDFVRFVAESTEGRVIHDGHWDTQTRVLLYDLIPYEVLGRFETFVEDFSRILHELAAPDSVAALAAEVTNSTASKSLSAAYEEQLADVVYRTYRADFDNFGYDRDSWQSQAGVRHK